MGKWGGLRGNCMDGQNYIEGFGKEQQRVQGTENSLVLYDSLQHTSNIVKHSMTHNQSGAFKHLLLESRKLNRENQAEA